MTRVKPKSYGQAMEIVEGWFHRKGWTAFPFQKEVWDAFLSGSDGLLNAPTGSGKTLALWMPVILDWIGRNPDYRTKTKNGLQLLWITPLRALTADIQRAMQEVAWDLSLPWLIKVRTGDTSGTDKALIRKQLPEVLITTPESLHIMLTQKDHPATFENLNAVVVDEWHELVGSKRGVQVELALSRLRGINATFRTWGISATIGNLDQALEVLLGKRSHRPRMVVKADIEKKVRVQTLLPDEIERYPWSGHLGLKMAHRVLPIIEGSQTTLLFVNTRGQSEMWYRQILHLKPELAGHMALHHGSLSREVRFWVEEGLREGTLKLVICTSSLDLGVDFAPVETVIQVGSPKGVGRFLQRAGRSGHRPGAESVIYFLPTNTLELIEAAALKEAIRQNAIEDRKALAGPLDVLVQYLLTLATAEGFKAIPTLAEIRSTFAYAHLTDEEWAWCLDFITSGGEPLHQYEEYSKATVADGRYRILKRRTATMHRLSIGTIVSENAMRVQFLNGSTLGTIEEGFISRLKPGDVFWYAAHSLELVRVKDMTAFVRKSKKKAGIIPSWLGGRMSLSTQLSEMLRLKLHEYTEGQIGDEEMQKVEPLLKLQSERSHVPNAGELLIEGFPSEEGYHLFFYPFEGRHVHEGLAALVAYRLSVSQPLSISIAMNDYGFELLLSVELDIRHFIERGLLSAEGIEADIRNSMNATEMAKRRFREIAQISGLIFTGFPGKTQRSRHLQSSTGLLFDVFTKYDPENLLLRQAYDEVLHYNLDQDRLEKTLQRIAGQRIVYAYPGRPTPFSFPILVDRKREKMTSEKLEVQIRKLKLDLEIADSEDSF